MKIVYCLNSIRYQGGIQRVTVVKANALADMPGNEVFLLVTDNKEGSIVHEISPKVHLIDLDVNYYYRDKERSVLSNFFVSLRKRSKHRRILHEYLVSINPDVVISVGTSEKYMLTSKKDRTWKIIREFHHVRNNYRKKTASNIIERFLAPFLDFYEFRIKDKQYDRIVVLTEEDKQTNWKGWENVMVMPNPVSFECNYSSCLSEKSVAAIGRLDPIKNFPSLINAFKMVIRYHQDWKLCIYGEGDLRDELQDQINQNKLQDNVFLMGFSNNIINVMTNSSIFALTSITEGFPLVITEAMECGVPVVSYQCPCGPRDIIYDGKDGFLVPVNDENTLAQRICQLIEDRDLRLRMGRAAKVRAHDYHVERIAKRWMELFNDVVN